MKSFHGMFELGRGLGYISNFPEELWGPAVEFSQAGRGFCGTLMSFGGTVTFERGRGFCCTHAKKRCARQGSKSGRRLASDEDCSDQKDLSYSLASDSTVLHGIKREPDSEPPRSPSSTSTVLRYQFGDTPNVTPEPEEPHTPDAPSRQSSSLKAKAMDAPPKTVLDY